MVELCRRDIIFYINTFVWQYNPKKPGRKKAGPFIAWQFQADAILQILKCVHEGRDLVIEKSREMGATWFCLIVMEWLWHFHPLNAILCISRNSDLVESPRPDSLFWKIDFILRYQPDWLLPKMTRQKMYFGNDDNESKITGEASTGKAGVGGRATIMFIDEFSQITEDYEVLHRTSDTADCRIFNGTHLGLDTAFYSLTRRPDMRKLQLHWSQHPAKKRGLYRYNVGSGKVEVLDKSYRWPVDFNFVMESAPVGGPYPGTRSPWYDLQCERKGNPRAVAMDLDINPEGTVSQFFNPMLIRRLLSYACPPTWTGHLLYDEKTAKPFGFTSTKPSRLDLHQSCSGKMNLWITPDAAGELPLDLYAIGVDPAFGSGATPSCVSVIRCTTGEMILEYADPNIKPHELAPVLVALGRLLRGESQTALLAWEQLGPGVQLGLYILQLGYRHIYYREQEMPMRTVRTISDSPGWLPNGESKRLLLAEYSVALETGRLTNRSEESLKECLKFKFTSDGRSVEHPEEVNNEDPSGARVNHGDRTMSIALAWKMAQILWNRRTDARSMMGEDGPPMLSLEWRRAWHENKRREAELA